MKHAHALKVAAAVVVAAVSATAAAVVAEAVVAVVMAAAVVVAVAAVVVTVAVAAIAVTVAVVATIDFAPLAGPDLARLKTEISVRWFSEVNALCSVFTFFVFLRGNRNERCLGAEMNIRSVPLRMGFP
jgi:hypothetical protein